MPRAFGAQFGEYYIWKILSLLIIIIIIIIVVVFIIYHHFIIIIITIVYYYSIFLFSYQFQWRWREIRKGNDSQLYSKYEVILFKTKTKTLLSIKNEIKPKFFIFDNEKRDIYSFWICLVEPEPLKRKAPTSSPIFSFYTED